MESVFANCINVSQVKTYRQLTGILMVSAGIADYCTDFAVAVLFVLSGDLKWTILMFLAIAITNIWSAFKYGQTVAPRKLTYLASICGFCSLRILVRFWDELDQNQHFQLLINSRFAGTMLESIPCAIIQIYVIVNMEHYPALIVVSVAFSLYSFAIGLRIWYKFSTSYETNDFTKEKQFEIMHVFLELWLLADLITRASSLALVMNTSTLRPYVLFTAPLIAYFVGFILDIVDNESGRERKEWLFVLSRSFPVALISIGSGFMFLLSAENVIIGRTEIILRYILSGVCFILYVVYHNVTNDAEFYYSWIVIYVVAVISAITTFILISTIGKSAIRDRGDSQWKEDGVI